MGFLIIILFLLLVGIIVALLMDRDGIRTLCIIASLKMFFGLSKYPPKNLVGTNITFTGCELRPFEGFDWTIEDLINIWLPRIYDNLVNGCLAHIETNLNVTRIRDKMISLITCESLEIECTESEIVCYQEGVKGRVLEQDLNNGIARIYICYQNISNFDVQSALIAHELGHIAVSLLYGANIGLARDRGGLL